jgi:hypothetical protein
MTRCSRSLSLAAAARRPRLVECGGFEVLDEIPGQERIYPSLLREALDLAGQAERQEHERDEASDTRGGSPARRLFSCAGGPVQTALYGSDRFLEFLAEKVGMPLSPTGLQGSYSYYVRVGDHLGLHRDIDECDVAVISCLCDTAGPDAGALQLYPKRLHEPLARIRSTPAKDRISMQLRPGQTIVLLGGFVPHATSPMAHGQKRIISALCYRGQRTAAEMFGQAA